MSAGGLGVRLRPYEAADAAALSALCRASVLGLGPSAYAPRQVAAWASRTPSPEALASKVVASSLTLVAVSETGIPLGYVVLGEAGHLDHLYCAPEAAGQGVGGQLYGAVERAARGLGVTRLFTEASEVARGFFHRRGFVILHRREIRIDEVVIHNWAMEKMLP